MRRQWEIENLQSISGVDPPTGVGATISYEFPNGASSRFTRHFSSDVIRFQTQAPTTISRRLFSHITYLTFFFTLICKTVFQPDAWFTLATFYLATIILLNFCFYFVSTQISYLLKSDRSFAKRKLVQFLAKTKTKHKTRPYSRAGRLVGEKNYWHYQGRSYEPNTDAFGSSQASTGKI